MSLKLQPADELSFQRPFTGNNIKAVLSLQNVHASGLPVVFKIKTTAPKQYCVRPNSGVLKPGETKEVQVLMQAMKEEPPLGVKSKDKFLVQACAVQADGATVDGWTAAAGDLWAEADRVRVGEVESFKLTVLYVDASSVGGSATVPPAVVPPQLPSVAPPVAAPAPVSSTASPQSQATVARPASTNSFGSPAAAQNSSPLAQSTTASPTPVTKAYGVAPSASVAAPPVAAAAPPKVSFASSGSQASLAVAPVDLPAIPADSQLVPKKQLQETKDELARLQELCDKYQRELMTSRSELRQRATASTATQESSNNANADPSGKLKVKAVRAADKTYSLAVVIFAALVAFLLGVFFF